VEGSWEANARNPWATSSKGISCIHMHRAPEIVNTSIISNIGRSLDKNVQLVIIFDIITIVLFIGLSSCLWLNLYQSKFSRPSGGKDSPTIY
jgi:hypothetical protein